MGLYDARRMGSWKVWIAQHLGRCDWTCMHDIWNFCAEGRTLHFFGKQKVYYGVALREMEWMDYARTMELCSSMVFSDCVACQQIFQSGVAKKLLSSIGCFNAKKISNSFCRSLVLGRLMKTFIYLLNLGGD